MARFPKSKLGEAEYSAYATATFIIGIGILCLCVVNFIGCCIIQRQKQKEQERADVLAAALAAAQADPQRAIDPAYDEEAIQLNDLPAEDVPASTIASSVSDASPKVPQTMI